MIKALCEIYTAVDDHFSKQLVTISVNTIGLVFKRY